MVIFRMCKKRRVIVDIANNLAIVEGKSPNIFYLSSKRLFLTLAKILHHYYLGKFLGKATVHDVTYLTK